MKQYKIKRLPPDELAHHGVKGQEWGVRRYQYEDMSLTPEGRIHYGVGEGDSRPKPSGTLINKKALKDINKNLVKNGVRDRRLREAHTIPKGTTIYRTSPNENEHEEGTTYISYTDADRTHYKGGWIRSQNKGKDIYENTYTLKEDINVPSRDETLSVVNKVMNENKNLVKSTVDSWLKAAMPEDSFTYNEWVMEQEDGYSQSTKTLRKRLLNEQLKKYGDMTPNEAAFFVMQSFGVNKQIREKVISELSRRGYNAMTDEASVGGHGFGREGLDPLIIFDRKGMFDKKSSKKIEEREDSKFNSEYNRMMTNADAWKRINDDW